MSRRIRHMLSLYGLVVLLTVSPACRPENTGAIPAPVTAKAVDADTGDAGALRFDTPVVDLGATKGELQHRFHLTNRGSSVVQVKKVVPSCACVTTNPDKSILQPGESTSLGVAINLLNKTVGKHSFLIEVEYMFGETPHVARGYLSARYEPDVRLSPLAVDLAVGAGPAAATLSLVDFREKHLKIKELRSSSPMVSARVREEPREFVSGWQYVIEVTFTGFPESLTGEHAMTLSVLTDDPLHPSFAVPVTVKKFDRIRVSPAAIRLTKVGEEVNVVVRDTGGEPVEIAGVDLADGLVGVSHANPAAVVRVVTFRAKAAPPKSGSLTAHIRVNKPCPATLPVTVSFGE